MTKISQKVAVALALAGMLSSGGAFAASASQADAGEPVTPTDSRCTWTAEQADIFTCAQTFGYTGVEQSFTVPKNTLGLTADVVGARGGQGSGARGGAAGVVQGALVANPGDVLFVRVGGTGGDAPERRAYMSSGGWNGGGEGPSGGAGVGGGGASDVRTISGGSEGVHGVGSEESLRSRVIVAGGSGGGGYLGAPGAHASVDGTAGSGSLGQGAAADLRSRGGSGGGGGLYGGGVGGYDVISGGEHGWQRVYGAGGDGSSLVPDGGTSGHSTEAARVRIEWTESVPTAIAEVRSTAPTTIGREQPLEVTVELPVDATGNVRLRTDEGVESERADIVAGVAHVSIPANTLNAGKQELTAIYSGGSTYAPSISGSFAVEITPTVSVVGVTVDAPEKPFGEAFIATVSLPGDATGSVSISATDKQSGKALVVGSGVVEGGTVSIATANLPVGAYELVASYAGDRNYLPSSASAGVATVVKATPEFTITGPTSVAAGALYVPVLSGPAPATGAVDFYLADRAGTPQLIGSGRYTEGVLTLNEPIKYLPQGKHVIYATYSGDANYYEAKTVEVTVIFE